LKLSGKSDTLRENIKITLLSFTGSSRYLLDILESVVVETNASKKREREALSSSMIFINSSRYEHFGINVVESMASGTPVIVHRSGGP
jgi:glycosyltransferase involved in cell wall biosynthesis